MGHCFTKPHDNRVPISYDYGSPPHHSQQLRQRTQQPQPQPRYPYRAPKSDPTPSSTSSSADQPILGKPYIDIKALYTFGKELGRGQFGVTYLCTEKATGRKYASPNRTTNIVEFKGAYEDRQSVHLVMELCLGGELFDRITAKGSYSEREAACIFKQIVNVVHACHFMGGDA
ncbi:Protein kinase domain [Sesbania bispinosa]|nr:Protein kinase domain [Sesbania bispinosa]